MIQYTGNAVYTTDRVHNVMTTNSDIGVPANGAMGHGQLYMRLNFPSFLHRSACFHFAVLQNEVVT